MKKIVLLIVFFTFAAFELGASEPLPDVNAGREYKNQVNLGVGFMTVSGSSEALVPAAYVAYARNLKGKFYLGGSLATRYAMFEGDSDGGCVIPVDMVWMTTAYFNAFWELPVIPRWLSFRCGAGVGLGYHSVEDYGSDNSISPYFNASMEWVLHCGKRIDVAFSPLIVGPSRFEFTPSGIIGNSKKEYTYMFDCLHLSVGVRF